MALASKPFKVGLRVLGSKPQFLFSPSTSAISKISVAHITGRASRVEPEEKVKPWPYRERGYSNWMAFFDGTMKRMGENSKIIVVEGPPAIGKTALAKSLAEELEMKYFPMVTADSFYINEYGHDHRAADKDLPWHLKSFDEKDFIKNPKCEKTIHLQWVLWYEKFHQYMDAMAHLLNTGQGVVLDRCVYSANVFADTLLEMGYINKQDRKMYQKYQDRVMHVLMKPHLIVYLDAPVSVVETNLKNRGRGEEKVFNRELLEKLEYNYKHCYLKTITQHAELLAYDWSSPGEAEVVVEDIERIDFDRFDIHDPKMEDWRMKREYQWSEKRWEVTEQQQVILSSALCTAVYDVPALLVSGEDNQVWEEAHNKIPGTRYQYGFNADMGDTGFLFRVKPHLRVWKDHSETKAAA